MKRRERGERRKENFTRQHRRHNRGTHLRATPSAASDDGDDDKEDDDDDDEEDNTFSSSRVSSVFLFRDHFRVWRRTTIPTTETRITER